MGDSKEDDFMLIDIHTHHIREKDNKVFSVVQGIHCVGIHPMDVINTDMNNMYIDVNENIVAIGECGIDKLCTASVGKQIEVFKQHVRWSEEYKLPLLIHCVKAQEELLKVRKEMHPVQSWIWHGFRGKPQQLQQLINVGMFVSFGPKYNRESLLQCPLEHLFLETDNASVTIESIYEKVSTDLCISMHELESIIENNYNFNIN